MMNLAESQPAFRQNAIEQKLSHITQSNFLSHPFLKLSMKSNVEWVLSNYLAMSQAFPFLQAGAQKELIFNVISSNNDVPRDYEITAAVMNFLCWDETGGHYAILENGQAGLSRILETSDRFHSNILKNDLARLFKKDVKPNYSSITKGYLSELYVGLSSLNPIQRVASMVAFERHAQQMIDALWSSLAMLFSANKDDLLYFKMHVGGDDPAEIYHVNMTFQMIDEIIKPTDHDEFFERFERAYAQNFNWCKHLVEYKYEQ